MKGDVAIFVAVGASLAAVVGLVWWGHSKKQASGGASGVPERVSLQFPDLKVGQNLFFDGKAANVTADARAVKAVVDMILTDRSFVSVVALDPALLGFRGSIPRSSIIRVEASDVPTFET